MNAEQLNALVAETSAAEVDLGFATVAQKEAAERYEKALNALAEAMDGLGGKVLVGDTLISLSWGRLSIDKVKVL